MKNGKVGLAIVCGSLNVGGGETMAAKLAGYIDNEHFDVKMFIIGSYQKNQISAYLEDNGVNFQCLNLSNHFRLEDYRIFSHAIKEFNPDVIHEHLEAAYSWIWAFLNNVPLVSTRHGDPYRQKNIKVTTAMKLKALQGNLKIIGCSKKTMALVKSCYKIKDKFLNYIYNPIDVSVFEKAAAVKKNARNFVALGRLSDVKNYPLMLEAFKLASASSPGIELFIAGNGPKDAVLKQLVKDLELEHNVHFLGNVQNVPELLSKTDVLLLSSISEACPMVIIEAMSAGLPIIATSVGGVPELVADNGMLIESGDTKAFADAIVYMANNPQDVEAMSKKSLVYCQKYDKSQIARQYENEYLALTSQRKK